jgi:hypothetical protein
MAVESTAEDTETMRLRHAASQTSGLLKAFAYHSVEKDPSGMVGKRSELKEKTRLAAMGAKTKRKISAV